MKTYRRTRRVRRAPAKLVDLISAGFRTGEFRRASGSLILAATTLTLACRPVARDFVDSLSGAVNV